METDFCTENPAEVEDNPPDFAHLVCCRERDNPGKRVQPILDFQRDKPDATRPNTSSPGTRSGPRPVEAMTSHG